MLFNFETSSNIIFGSGKISELPGIVLSFGLKILVVTGASSRFDPYLDTLSDNSCELKIYRVKREPLIEDVDNAVRIAREFQASVIVGIARRECYRYSQGCGYNA